MRGHLAVAASALLLTVSLAACGDDDQPAVCSSAKDLKSAINDFTSIDVTSSNGLSDLKEGLANVRDDLQKLKSDASSEFSGQVDAVDAAVSTLTASLEAAASEPNGTNLAAVVSAVPAVASSVKTLVTDVQNTC
jgi:hypothetical protein